MSKSERLQIFVQRLKAANRAASAEDALDLLSTILNAVEDEFSGLPCNPHAGQKEGRMYSPQQDNRHEVPDRPSVCRYRSAQHNTYFGLNGAIRIETTDGKVLLDKPGRDGRKIHDIDA